MQGLEHINYAIGLVRGETDEMRETYKRLQHEFLQLANTLKAEGIRSGPVFEQALRIADVFDGKK